MSGKNTEEKEQKKQGQKRGREGEKEHPSSGKDKTRRAVSTSSSRDIIDQFMEDDEDYGEGSQLAMAIAASFRDTQQQ
ncbi:hypothetical protein [Methylobacter sp.]|uniref:hypothetical protein n=1 Tax=Methylobacter sp. TaxID=2051955 RepID=UPI003DA3EC38